jgi:hypothetical protein
MKLLLTYLFVTFLLALRTTRRGRTTQAWPLLVAAVFVGAAFLSQRVL